MGEPPAKRAKFCEVQKGGLREWLKEELEDLGFDEHGEDFVKKVADTLAGYSRRALEEAKEDQLESFLATRLGRQVEVGAVARALWNRIHPKQLPPATGHDHRTL